MKQEKVVNMVTTGSGDERSNTRKSDAIYQQCVITSDNDIPRKEVQCLSDSRVIILPALGRKLLDLFNL
jgi:hypothetical protein